eukprot:m.114315 g.114315  ORF g.114315 m.114315 type:complete len:359 (+) comp37485_c0_seq3:286-1362(+)
MELEKVVSKAKHFSACIGLLVKSDKDLDAAVHSPFTLFPTEVSKKVMNYGASLQPWINTVMDRVSINADFLHGVLDRVATTDDFTCKLLNIFYETLKRRTESACALLLVRSDYLLDSSTKEYTEQSSLKQVETNMIAAAGGSHAQKMAHLHRYVWSLCNGGKPSDYSNQLPENPVIENLTKGIAAAWEEYGCADAIAVTLCSRNEINIYGMLYIEFCLWEKHGITHHLIVIDDIIEGGCMKVTVDKNSTLFIGPHKVAVVYYRTGYSPSHYPTEKHWKARQLLDISNSFQCPSVGQQLAGTKVVQQRLTLPKVLERFLYDVDAAAVEKLRATFCEIRSLDQKGMKQLIWVYCHQTNMC